jgi:dolichol kinase
MAAQKRAIGRSLGQMLAAFVVGVAAGCFFSNYVVAKTRSHAGFFTMAGFDEPDYPVESRERGSS